ncbi:helix-turn-helix domain-containing protein [Streptomyces sp. NPDC059679]|uniref:helix-turn-helix domain-containing protein n=1 Tax=Streptomyces sp. NPDC059679 TaxID=3346903 RepID=UPI0036CD777F
MELNNEGGKLTPRVRLGNRLRRLRERKGLSLRQLSERVGGYSHSYLGRVELGEQLPSDALVEALDKFFDTDGVLADLLDAARDSVIQDYSRAVVTKERDAVRIQVFTSSVIPGLLQTEDYALELFRTGMPGKSEDELRASVDARMKRQRIFEAQEPPFYWAIMDEAALKRPIGSSRHMSAQLESVIQASENPHITVQVLPFAQGAHSMLGGSLILLALKEGGTVGLVESFKNGESVESPKRVAELVQHFEIACSKALPENESLDLIHQYLKEYRNEG